MSDIIKDFELGYRTGFHTGFHRALGLIIDHCGESALSMEEVDKIIEESKKQSAVWRGYEDNKDKRRN